MHIADIFCSLAGFKSPHTILYYHLHVSAPIQVTQSLHMYTVNREQNKKRQKKSNVGIHVQYEYDEWNCLSDSRTASRNQKGVRFGTS